MIALRFSWLVAAGLGVAAGALVSIGASSCAVNSASDSGTGGDFGAGTGYGSTTGAGDANVKPDGEDPPKKLVYTELCGRGPCLPDPVSTKHPNDCLSDGTSATSSGTGTTSSGTGVGGASGAGGGSSADVTSSGTGAGTGTGGGVFELGCQVAGTEASPKSICAPTGPGEDNAACNSASDCKPGKGCVLSAAGVSICRDYCCGDLEDCPKSPPDVITYCTPRPMAEDTERKIPVCLPTTPCTVFFDSMCPDDQTCSVVRTDGSTSCVDKGTGTQCEACPCAAGFMCSTTGTCLKLCHTSGATPDECEGGVCQGGVLNLPAGVGQCVGGTNDCATK